MNLRNGLVVYHEYHSRCASLFLFYRGNIDLEMTPLYSMDAFLLCCFVSLGSRKESVCVHGECAAEDVRAKREGWGERAIFGRRGEKEAKGEDGSDGGITRSGLIIGRKDDRPGEGDWVKVDANGWKRINCSSI